MLNTHCEQMSVCRISNRTNDRSLFNSVYQYAKQLLRNGTKQIIRFKSSIIIGYHPALKEIVKSDRRQVQLLTPEIVKQTLTMRQINSWLVTLW